MHEVSLVQNLMEQVRQIAAKNDAETVISIRVLIGAFSGVVRDSFAFAFEVLRQEEALFSGCRLEIHTPEPVFRCCGCGREFKSDEISAGDAAPAPGWFGMPATGAECPGCGKEDMVPVGGDEILLMQVEME